ncbi:uncharacterized protein H6S33_005952 [Morchella sextelata]|uniref:uncharacterized protein n=1 Tax=Morchella sextelata TaxID=1174677 RepID=UPI001D05A2A2|nr:uncharacterized protein H6S33_005952 [Morchella sextelata]KAH0614066.1 hypothetical protein H6S33_005952 [Morchella sextelata]
MLEFLAQIQLFIKKYETLRTTSWRVDKSKTNRSPSSVFVSESVIFFPLAKGIFFGAPSPSASCTGNKNRTNIQIDKPGKEKYPGNV